MEILSQHAFQHNQGFRPLQVYLARLVGNVLQAHRLGQPPAQGGEVGRDTGGIDHDHEGIRPKAIDDAVVHDAAAFVEDEAVAAFAFLEGGKVVADRAGKRGIGPFALDKEFSHVADVEQSGVMAGMLVLHQDPFILDGHEPARERGHLGAAGLMPGGERRCAAFFGHEKPPRATACPAWRGGRRQDQAPGRAPLMAYFPDTLSENIPCHKPVGPFG